MQESRSGDDRIGDSGEAARTVEDGHWTRADVRVLNTQSGIVIRLPRRIWQEWLNVP